MNPLLAEALITSRAGTVHGNPRYAAKPEYPTALDDSASMARWEPLVRMNVCLLDLLSHVRFETCAKEECKPDASSDTVCLRHIELLADDRYTNPPIFTMTRPPESALAAQLRLVESHVRHRQDRTNEILAQLMPQTPFWSAVAHLQPNKNRFTFELMEVALAFAAIVCMRLKQALAVPRPAALSPNLQPMIPTPEHGSLPAGHASEAYMAAHVLEALHHAPSEVGHVLRDQAARISINRTIAGVHFPMDNTAGRMLGASLAEYFLYHGTENTPVWKERAFVLANDGADFDGAPDWTSPSGTISSPPARINGPLFWLWNLAANESKS